jgi:type I restriction enzyme S subunit
MSNSVQDRRLPKEWRWAKFDEFLRRIERKVIVDDLSSYDCVGVRWYGMGAFIRENLPGISIARKQQWLIKAGDVVYNKLFAWKGSFALADSDVDGCIVSDKFPTYQLDTTVVNPQFLRYYFRTMDIAQQALALSKGGAAISKLTLNPPQFWDLAIPLPTFKEQQRIVERIEGLMAKTEKAQSFHRDALEAAKALNASTANALFELIRVNDWPVVELGDIADIHAGVTLGRSLNGPTIRLPYLRVANVQDGFLDLGNIKETDILPNEFEKWQLKPGDILLTEGGDWDKLGRGAVWHAEIPNCIHQNHIFCVRTNPADFNPNFLLAVISSPYGKAYFQGASKQTTNLASINQKQLKAFKVFQPPLSEQDSIVAYLNDLQAKVSMLKAAQTRTSMALDAILPSILDKAFKGEL